MDALHRMVFAGFGIGLISLLSACGQEPEAAALAPNLVPATVQQSILRGTPTGQDAFGSVGALIKTDSRGRALNWCTGSLIAPDVVLTAAHCVVSRPSSDDRWQLWFSTDSDLSQFAQKELSRVAHIQVHPDFDSLAKLDAPLAWRAARTETEAQILQHLSVLCGEHPIQHVTDPAFWQCVTHLPYPLQQALGVMDSVFDLADVAVVILASPVLEAPLARLPTAVTAPLQPKQLMQAAGYGDFGPTRTPDQHGVLHQGVVTLDGIGQFALQVGFADSQVALGDSGGPLFVAGDEAMEIVGIASRSFMNKSRLIQGPTLYSKTQAYTPWIRSILRDACATGQRSAQMCKGYPF